MMLSLSLFYQPHFHFYFLTLLLVFRILSLLNNLEYIFTLLSHVMTFHTILRH